MTPEGQNLHTVREGKPGSGQALLRTASHVPSPASIVEPTEEKDMMSAIVNKLYLL